MTEQRAAPFLDLLRDSGLLDREQLKALIRDPEARGADARALARLAVRRGLLTRFQVKQIALGRGKELVLGQYRLLDRLGEGGMGQVFKAQHVTMNRLVALKLIRKERLARPGAVARFYQEAEAAGKLSHPNIVLAFDASQVGNVHYLAMEYVEGIDLSRLVRESGPLAVEQACDYIRQAALGLQHAHERGLVHRDIKPSNLLVTRPAAGRSASAPGGGAVVKVLDMGLARLDRLGEGDTGLTRDGQIVGTPEYLAPEQARDSRNVDVRADLYSLGCTFYFLLTGRAPFQAPSVAELLVLHQMHEPTPLEQVRSDVPAAVSAVVRKLMAKRPEERFQTAAELAAVLEPLSRGDTSAWVQGRAARPSGEGEFDWESVLGGESQLLPTTGKIGTEGTPTAPASQAAPRRRLSWAALAGGGLAVLAVVLGVVLHARISERPDDNAPAPGDASPPGVVQAAGPTPGVSTLPVVDTPGKGKEPPAALVEPMPPRRVEPVVAPPAGVDARPFAGHTGALLCLAVSFDGRRALSGGDDASVRVWDVESGKEIARLTGHAGAVAGVAVSPDGRRALSAGADRTVRLWDLETAREVRRFEGHEAPVACVAFSRDGRRAASAGGALAAQAGMVVPVDCAVRLWDVDTGRETRRLEGHIRQIRGLAFTADGQRILSGSDDGTLRLWDVETGQAVRTIGGGGPLSCLALAPEGRRALTGGADRMLRLWDLEAGREIRPLAGHAAPITGVAFAPDGLRALSCGGGPEVRDGKVVLQDSKPVPTDCLLRLWDVELGKELGRFAGHEDVVQAVAFLPDGRRALSAGRDRILRLWDLARPTSVPPPEKPAPVVATPPGRFEGHTKPVTTVAFLPDSSRVLTGSQDRSLRLWDVATGKELGRFEGHPGEIRSLVVSADGSRAASGDSDGQVRLWDLATRQMLRSLAVQGAVDCLAFAPRGDRLYLGGADGLVQVWALEGGNAGGVVHVYGMRGRSVHALACSPDGKLLVYGDGDGQLHLVSLESRIESRFLGQHKGPVVGLAFTPEGRSVLSAGADRTVRLWTVATGRETRTFRGHGGAVTSLALAADGQQFLTGCADRVVRLWSVRTSAQPVRQLTGHTEAVRAVALAPDGRWALSGGENLRLWPLKPTPAALKTATP